MPSLALCVALAAAVTVDGLSLQAPVRARIRPLRMMANDDPPDDDLPDSLPDSLSLDMGLLKMPRLTTPQRQSYENFRKRQQERATGSMGLPGGVGGIDGRFDVGAPGPTPLGQDPVEGDPVDLSMYDESGWVGPTREQEEAAEQDIGMTPRDDDFDSDVDRLLGK